MIFTQLNRFECQREELGSPQPAPDQHRDHGMVVGALRTRGAEAVEHCGLGVFEIGQREDAFRPSYDAVWFSASTTASFSRRRQPL